MRSGYLTPAISGAQKRVELLRNPCIFGGPQHQARAQNQNWMLQPCLLGGPTKGGIATQAVSLRGSPTPSAATKSEVATTPLPSRGPKRGWNCYATGAFSGVLKKGDKIRSGYLTPAFSGAQKRAELLRNPCILWVPNVKRGDKIRSGYLTPAFSGAQKRAKLLRNPCILWVPNVKRGDKIRSGYLTPAFSGAQKRAELLRNPCILWVPNAKCGDKIRSGCLTPAFSGAQKRVKLLWNPYPCILEGPEQRGGNQKWLPHPCLLGGPKEGGIACTTPAFSRVPKTGFNKGPHWAGRKTPLRQVLKGGP